MLFTRGWMQIIPRYANIYKAEILSLSDRELSKHLKYSLIFDTGANLAKPSTCQDGELLNPTTLTWEFLRPPLFWHQNMEKAEDMFVPYTHVFLWNTFEYSSCVFLARPVLTQKVAAAVRALFCYAVFARRVLLLSFVLMYIVYYSEILSCSASCNTLGSKICFCSDKKQLIQRRRARVNLASSEKECVIADWQLWEKDAW